MLRLETPPQNQDEEPGSDNPEQAPVEIDEQELENRILSKILTEFGADTNPEDLSSEEREDMLSLRDEFESQVRAEMAAEVPPKETFDDLVERHGSRAKLLKHLTNCNQSELGDIAQLALEAMPSDSHQMHNRSLQQRFDDLVTAVSKGDMSLKTLRKYSPLPTMSQQRIDRGEVTEFNEAFKRDETIRTIQELGREEMRKEKEQEDQEAARLRKERIREQNRARGEEERAAQKAQEEHDQGLQNQIKILNAQWAVKRKVTLAPDDQMKLANAKMEHAKKNTAEQQKQADRDREFEPTVARYAEEGEWFGPGAEIFAASEFDDRCNGADFIVKLPNGVLLGVDFTTSSSTSAHIKTALSILDRPLREVEYPTCTKIKKGELSIPISLGIDRELTETLEHNLTVDMQKGNTELSMLSSVNLVTGDLPYVLRDIIIKDLDQVKNEYASDEKIKGTYEKAIETILLLQDKSGSGESIGFLDRRFSRPPYTIDPWKEIPLRRSA